MKTFVAVILLLFLIAGCSKKEEVEILRNPKTVMVEDKGTGIPPCPPFCGRLSISGKIRMTLKPNTAFKISCAFDDFPDPNLNHFVYIQLSDAKNIDIESDVPGMKEELEKFKTKLANATNFVIVANSDSVIRLSRIEGNTESSVSSIDDFSKLEMSLVTERYGPYKEYSAKAIFENTPAKSFGIAIDVVGRGFFKLLDFK